MKISGHVLSVADHGEKCLVVCQGVSPGNAAWRPWQSFEFELPTTGRNGKTFHIGRKVEITIEVK